uniref:Uncharacterized protein n=1 Tax=Arundo donax TaxID=35708 RepID=A0A0A9F9D1_ARUDO
MGSRAAGVRGLVRMGRVPRRRRHGARRRARPPRLAQHRRRRAPRVGLRRRGRRPRHPLHRPLRAPPRGVPLLRRRRAPGARRQVATRGIRGLLPQLRRSLPRLLWIHHYGCDREPGSQRRASVPVVPTGERRLLRPRRVPVLRQVHAGPAEAARRVFRAAAVGSVRPARWPAVRRVAGGLRLLQGGRWLLEDRVRELLPVLVRRGAPGAR